MPEILLRGDARRVRLILHRIGADEVAGVTAADAGRLHAARRGEICRAEADALHAGARRGDLLDAGDANGRLEDGVELDGTLHAGARLELGEELIGVVDVLRSVDLGDHDDVELVADLGHETDEVIEAPRAVEAVHARPELRVAEGRLLRDPHEALAGVDLLVALDGVLEVAEDDVDLLRDIRHLGRHLRVRRIEEVDHPRRAEGDLAQRRGGAEGQRREEGSGITHMRRFSSDSGDAGSAALIPPVAA